MPLSSLNAGGTGQSLMANFSAIVADLQRFGPLQTVREPVPLPQARRYCAGLMRRHFPHFLLFRVAVPRRLQQHFANIFAFWRWGKDLAQHLHDPRSGLALLDWWHRLLQDCYAGEVAHPVFVALRETIETFGIPRDPFADLLAGFRQDQQVRRYQTSEEVLAYCRYAANPLGRVILLLAGCPDARYRQPSDHICTGIAWVSFCRNVARDVRAGRIYLPLTHALRYGYSEEDFLRRTYNQPFKLFLEGELAEAEGWLLAGRKGLTGLPRWVQFVACLAVGEALEWIRRIRASEYNVWTGTVRISRWEWAHLLARTWWDLRRGRLVPQNG
jgi:squalene synthase HpnC